MSDAYDPVWPRVEQALGDCGKFAEEVGSGNRALARCIHRAAFAIVQALANVSADLRLTIREESQATREELRVPR